MKRLRLSILCAVAVVALGVTTYLVAAKKKVIADVQPDHNHAAVSKPESGPLSNATVSFGAWISSPPHDRFPNVSNTRLFNHHVLIPDVAKIKAGGTVNFIIAGFHQVIVYDDGTQPTDINTNLTIPLTFPLAPPSPLLINDPNRRIYRGLDPSTLALDRLGTTTADRVEVVHFAEPGTYLVICGVLPHFQANMYGFVKVVP
jgi:plastocyanin